MKIVIDIDENLYTRLFDNGVDNYDDAVDMAKAIRKGTLLPKEHGRIIDESKITTIWYYERKIETGTLIQPYIEIDHTDAPTIIEAERGESE